MSAGAKAARLDDSGEGAKMAPPDNVIKAVEVGNLEHDVAAMVVDNQESDGEVTEVVPLENDKTEVTKVAPLENEGMETPELVAS